MMARVMIVVALVSGAALAQSGSGAGSAKPVPIAKARCSDLVKREAAVKQREDAVAKREADVSASEHAYAEYVRRERVRAKEENAKLSRALK
jgi:hypothetical protein